MSLLSLAAIALLTGCSPTCLLVVRFISPAGTATMAEERLFVTGVKACPPGDVVAPAPAVVLGDIEYVRKNAVDGGLEVTAAFRGRHCRVQISAWYDGDADGKVSSGDWTGSSSAEDVQDRGLFGDNTVRSKDVVLRASR